MNELLVILDECIDQEKLAKVLAQKFLLPKLEALVADTETKFDDAALASVKKALGL